MTHTYKYLPRNLSGTTNVSSRELAVVAAAAEELLLRLLLLLLLLAAAAAARIPEEG